MSAVTDALRVFLTDPKIRAWLDTNDPMSVEQAERALAIEAPAPVEREYRLLVQPADGDGIRFRAFLSLGDRTLGDGDGETAAEAASLAIANGVSDHDGPDDPVETLRRGVLRRFPDATELVLETSEWDNGYFYTTRELRGTGSVPGIEPSDIDEEFSDELTALSSQHGPLGRVSKLTINLLTGEVS